MNILNQLLQIITLQRRPSEIDYSETALALAFAGAVCSGYLFAGAFLEVFSEISKVVLARPPFWLIVIQLLTQSGFFYLLLKYNNKENRFVQTVTALFGITALMQLVCFVSLQVPQLLIVTPLAIGWNIYLMVAVLSQAIECSPGKALLIIIAYNLTVDQLFALLIT
jgi:hypothetical protein